MQDTIMLMNEWENEEDNLLSLVGVGCAFVWLCVLNFKKKGLLPSKHRIFGKIINQSFVIHELNPHHITHVSHQYYAVKIPSSVNFYISKQ